MQYHTSNSTSAISTIKFTIQNLNWDNTKIIEHQGEQMAFWPIFLANESETIQERLSFLSTIYSQENTMFNRKISEKDQEIFTNLYKKSVENFCENMQKIDTNDEIFLYIDPNANGILFLGFFLSICKSEKIFVNILEHNDDENSENWRWSFGMYREKDFREKFFEKWKILTEDEKNFYKNIFSRANQNENCIKIWKNNEMIFVENYYFDEKILKYLEEKTWKKTISITTFIGYLLGYGDFPKEILSDTFLLWRICELKKEWKIIFKEIKSGGVPIVWVKKL